MTSFSIAEGGGRACNRQKFKIGRISHMYENRTHLSQVRSSTIYDFTTQCYPHSQQDVNAQKLICRKREWREKNNRGRSEEGRDLESKKVKDGMEGAWIHPRGCCVLSGGAPTPLAHHVQNFTHT